MSDELAVTVDIKFAIIPEWIIYADVSDRAFRLYAVLRKHANNETGESRPSRARLATLLRVSLSTIDRTLDELVKAGAIEIRHRWSNAEKTAYSSVRDSLHVVPAPNLYVVKSVPATPSRGTSTRGGTPTGDERGTSTGEQTGTSTGGGRGTSTGDARTRPTRTTPNRTKSGSVSEVSHQRVREVSEEISSTGEDTATDPAAGCGLCKGTGWVAPAVKCTHSLDEVETAQRGAALCREALDEKRAQRSATDPTYPSPRRAPSRRSTRRTAPATASRR
ncbi:helix-turn-helix domain-containing protein [Nocardia fluminea]|uniref:helix-turn-helix domain-containing protein n=1 Tax=Nocardia fluminea TaxID=134984 RepID=UPI00365DF3C9